MSPTLDAFLRSWPFDPWLIALLILPGALYLRGWLLMHRRDPQRWHGGQLSAFLGGLTVLFLALASPIEPFAALLLQIHMAQHLLLMMLAPPLLWLGAPLFPLLRGLPQPIRLYWIAPLLRSRYLRHVCECLTHPAAALPLFAAAAWVWHVPAIYEMALRSSFWHYLQHVCFLGTGLLFWYPVVRPYPSRPRWSAWLLLPYLLLADVQNTALSALLTFANRGLYPYYQEVPRLGGMSALEDQAAAGVLMWVPGSLAFLLPLFAIGVQLMAGGKSVRAAHAAQRSKRPHGTPLTPLPRRYRGGGAPAARIAG
jgi:cytochrome c oxidase assembly factor CtaG